MNEYLNQIQRTGSVTPQATQNSFQQRQNPQDQSAKLQQDILSLQEQITNQKNQFDRYVHITQQRVLTLEREVKELRDQLAKTSQIAEKIKDKQVVEQTREALFNHKERPPADKPIDRNNVAPKDVQIGNIFNFSGRR